MAMLAVGWMSGCDRPQAGTPLAVLVGAAASTAPVVAAIVGEDAVVHAAGSGVLAAQIRHGAPVDVVVVADGAWLDDLERDGLLVEGTRTSLAGNEAVMVVRKDDAGSSTTRATRWVTADAATAPLGEAAVRGWRSIDWADDDLAAVLLVEDAAAAVRVLQSGEADAGVLYATDARRLGERWMVRRFPDPLVATVRCEGAIVRDSPAARTVLARLHDASARAAWRDAGFTVEVASP